jgi:hypothetical protein
MSTTSRTQISYRDTSVTDREDGRVVRVGLTPDGEEILQKLSRAHLDRLNELAAVLDGFVTRHDVAEAVSAGDS